MLASACCSVDTMPSAWRGVAARAASAFHKHLPRYATLLRLLNHWASAVCLQNMRRIGSESQLRPKPNLVRSERLNHEHCSQVIFVSSQLLERSCKLTARNLRFRVQKSLCLAMTQTNLDVIDLQIIAKANLVPSLCDFPIVFVHLPHLCRRLGGLTTCLSLHGSYRSNI